MLLKQSTAQTVVIGPILDADGVAVTTAVVTNISIAKNGSAAALTTETLTHVANGYYTLALTSGNLNQLGNLEVFVNNTAMSMTVFRWNVIAAQVYDSIVSGSDLLQIDIQQLVGSAQDASRILIGATAQHEVAVTGSNHVAADVHEFQPGVITAADFAAGAIDATVLATDAITSSQLAASAVTEIQAGLATSSGVTSAFTEIKGATWSSSTDTLEAIRDASGGGGDSIIVTPIVAQTPVRTVASNISTFKGDRSAITVGVFDELDPVDLSALGALEVCIQTKAGTDLQVIANANITISGADNNYFSFSPGSAAVATVGRFMWSLRVAASNSKRVIAYGAWIVEDAALNDA